MAEREPRVLHDRVALVPISYRIDLAAIDGMDRLLTNSGRQPRHTPFGLDADRSEHRLGERHRTARQAEDTDPFSAEIL